MQAPQPPPAAYEAASRRTLRGAGADYRDDYVYVAPSPLLQAPHLGVLASRDLPAGTVVAEYTGYRLTVEQAAELRGNKYLFDVSGADGEVAFVLDPLQANSGSVARFANAANTEPQQNAMFRQVRTVNSSWNIFQVAAIHCRLLDICAVKLSVRLATTHVVTAAASHPYTMQYACNT